MSSHLRSSGRCNRHADGDVSRVADLARTGHLGRPPPMSKMVTAAPQPPPCRQVVACHSSSARARATGSLHSRAAAAMSGATSSAAGRRSSTGNGQVVGRERGRGQDRVHRQHGRMAPAKDVTIDGGVERGVIRRGAGSAPGTPSVSATRASWRQRSRRTSGGASSRSRGCSGRAARRPRSASRCRAQLPRGHRDHEARARVAQHGLRSRRAWGAPARSGDARRAASRR